MLKLINFFDCPYLNALRNGMDAPLSKDFKSNNEITFFDEDLIRKLGREGIDLQLEEIIPQEDKTLSYHGQRVLVYIRDVANYKNNHNPFPRFHLAYCKKLEEMRQNNRWQRYVVSNRDDGYFQINLNNNGWKSSSEKLDICRFCLITLQWENFSHRMLEQYKNKIVSEFSIENFFKKYPKSLFSVKPVYTSDIAPINAYTTDWPTVSENLKQKKGYQCDICRLVLIGRDKKHLHVHHIDGQKFNNRESNLQVLCLACHAEQPNHSHMKNSKYEEFKIRKKELHGGISFHKKQITQ